MTTTVHNARTNQPTKALQHFNAVAPHNTNEYDPPIVFLRVGTAGNLTVTNLKGEDIEVINCVAGEIVWGPFLRVLATGTDADDLVGWGNEECDW